MLYSLHDGSFVRYVTAQPKIEPLSEYKKETKVFLTNSRKYTIVLIN